MLMMAFPVGIAEAQDDKPRDYARRNVVEFESDLLRLDSGSKVDLSRFSFGSSASPGIYRVSIFINGAEAANEEVEFKADDDRQVYPCLTPRLIELINFNEDNLPSEMRQALATPATCANLEKLFQRPSSNLTVTSRSFTSRYRRCTSTVLPAVRSTRNCGIAAFRRSSSATMQTPTIQNTATVATTVLSMPRLMPG
jgi:hypothetical protein